MDPNVRMRAQRCSLHGVSLDEAGKSDCVRTYPTTSENGRCIWPVWLIEWANCSVSVTLHTQHLAR